MAAPDRRSPEATGVSTTLGVAFPPDPTLPNVLQLLSQAIAGGTTVIMPKQAATASAPTYVAGGVYYDTTLHKLRIGGASGWETVTSV